MISNGWKKISSTYSLAIYTFLLFPIINCELYSYGPTNGDAEIIYGNWSLGSQQINLTTSMPLLGAGRLSSVWVNSIGALTYRRLSSTPPINSTTDNILIAPYYVQSNGGIIHYRQTTTDTALFDLIQDDFETALILPPNENEVDTLFDFRPTFAMIVTWSNMTSATNPDLTNIFQIALVTDGRYSFAIYNYGDLQWTSSAPPVHAAAGLYVSENSESLCHYELPSSQTAEVSSLPLTVANSGELGRFILIISEPFECVSAFETACEKDLPSSDWGTARPFFSIGTSSWDSYVLHECNAGFEIRPGVKRERIDCIYEADYYDSTWEKDASKCLDFNATKMFNVKVGITKIGGNDSLIPPGEMTDEQEDELKKLVEEAVTSLVNMTDVIVVVNNITTANDQPRRTGGTTSVKVNVTIHIPPYIHKKTTADNISDVITETIADNEDISGVTFHPDVDVTDSTDVCLQGCMCRFRPQPRKCPKGKNPLLKPDSCCGGCGGKPYSSTIKACCGNARVYDPLKARCCDGRIRKGATGKCP